MNLLTCHAHEINWQNVQIKKFRRDKNLCAVWRKNDLPAQPWMTDPYCCSDQAKALSVRCKTACFFLLFPDRAFAFFFISLGIHGLCKLSDFTWKTCRRWRMKIKTKEEEKMKGNDRGGKGAQQTEKMKRRGCRRRHKRSSGGGCRAGLSHITKSSLSLSLSLTVFLYFFLCPPLFLRLSQFFFPLPLCFCLSVPVPLFLCLLICFSFSFTIFTILSSHWNKRDKCIHCGASVAFWLIMFRQ